MTQDKPCPNCQSPKDIQAITLNNTCAVCGRDVGKGKCVTQDKQELREWLKLWRPVFYGKPVEPEDVDELVEYVTDKAVASPQSKATDKTTAQSDLTDKQEAWATIMQSSVNDTVRWTKMFYRMKSVTDLKREVRSLLAHQREEIVDSIEKWCGDYMALANHNLEYNHPTPPIWEYLRARLEVKKEK